MNPEPEFTLDQLEYALSALGNLLRANVFPSEALREMQYLQPKFAEFWLQASQQAANGHSLAATLQPILDDGAYAAIHAAETSGTLTVVLLRLQEAMREKRAIRKTLRTMYYPFATLFGAVGVFLLYLAFVVPSLAASLPRRPGSTATTLNVIADQAHAFLVTYWPHLTAVAVIGGAILVLWLRNPENRNTVLSILDRFPILGPATRDLSYGEWSRHMAIHTHAGITVPDAIHLTHVLLPRYYQPEIGAVQNDIIRLGLANAATARDAYDVRANLPFLIVNAFRIADKTGSADIQFETAAVALVEQGRRRIELFVATANNIITPLAAILGASAIVPYFMQVGSTFSPH
ncbi:Putative type II secretion system protein F [Rhodocyclaceae bacterium]|nr:Putative type II secretion system protein F [Rhodocyclaceae bacterium]